MTEELRPINAYRYPRMIRPGCQHLLGCRCTPPYWLRQSTPEEIEIEQRLWPVAPVLQIP